MLNIVSPNAIEIRSGRLREDLKSANGEEKKCGEGQPKTIFDRHKLVISYYVK